VLPSTDRQALATQHRRERTLIGALGPAGEIQWRDRSSRRPRAGGTHCERLSQRRIVRNAPPPPLLLMAMRRPTFLHGLAHHPEGGRPGRRREASSLIMGGCSELWCSVEDS